VFASDYDDIFSGKDTEKLQRKTQNVASVGAWADEDEKMTEKELQGC
jgi:hypothetical protein